MSQQSRPVRARFWVRSLASAFAAALAVVTVLVPDWIEGAFGVRPDAGGGELEWFVVGALAVVAVALGVAAGREWGRLAATSASDAPAG